MFKRLGDLLKERSLVDEAAIVEALKSARLSGRKLGKELVERGAISEQDLIRTLGDQLGVKSTSLADYPFDPEVAELVPREACEKYLCVPLELAPNNWLYVAMDDPVNHELVQYLSFTTGKHIISCLATAEDIRGAINRIYGFGVSLDELVANVEGIAKIKAGSDQSGADARAQTVTEIVRTLLGEAVAKGASDIHMEPLPASLRIRMRIDGQLQNLVNIPKWLQAQVVAVTKVQAKLDIAEKRQPQDGKLSLHIAGRQVDFRISTLPTPQGEKVVIRILDKRQKGNRLQDLGLAPALLKSVEGLLQNEKGMILVTGPTGSGKTTLLYAMLAELQRKGTNIVTVEDPIEYEFDGITQTQINIKAGMTFPNILRSILRQDPNVIMIGEIRDQETAQIAFRAAQTGHLVLSTLHTNNAAAAVARLLDLGIEPTIISATVLGIFAQRLVRRNCRECVAEDATAAQQDSPLMRLVPPGTRFRRGQGCKACGFTGYRGRIGVVEYLSFTPAVVNAVNAGLPEDQLAKAAVADGMRSLADESARLVAEGVTSLEECVGIAASMGSAESAKATLACPACERDISPDFRVCPYCQYVLAKNCPKCNRAVEPEWSACPFCMTLLKQAPPATAAAEARPKMPGEKPRVLVADDEAAIRKALGIILKQIGCEMIEAVDGRDALDKVEIYRPDVIISDINMPRMDGYEFCRQVRKNLSTAFTPFIMLTSRANAQDKLMGFLQGTDDYVTKPFDYRELQMRVKRMLARTAAGTGMAE